MTASPIQVLKSERQPGPFRTPAADRSESSSELALQELDLDGHRVFEVLSEVSRDVMRFHHGELRALLGRREDRLVLLQRAGERILLRGEIEELLTRDLRHVE